MLFACLPLWDGLSPAARPQRPAAKEGCRPHLRGVWTVLLPHGCDARPCHPRADDVQDLAAPNSFKLSARLSILLIPQGLILLGLSPIAEEKEEATPSSSTSSGVTSTSTSASADGASLPMSAGEVAALPSPPPSPSVSTEGIYHHATVHLHPSPPPSPPVAGSINRLCAKCGYQCTLATSKFCTNCGNPFNVVQTEAVEMMAAADMPTATAAPEVAAAGWQQLNIMVLKPTPTSIMGVDLVDTPTGQVAIAHVYPNFPLYGKVGVGDIVLKVNHATVLPPTRQAVQAALTDAPPGDMIITVERTGGTFTSSSNNGTGGAATAVGLAGETVVVQVFKPLPTTVMGVNCAMAVDGHVTITHIFPGYPMHGVLLVGDAILAINGQPLEQTTASVIAALQGAPAGTVQLMVKRGSRAGGGSGGAPRPHDYSAEDPFAKLFACAWQCDPLWFLFALAPKWFARSPTASTRCIWSSSTRSRDGSTRLNTAWRATLSASSSSPPSLRGSLRASRRHSQASRLWRGRQRAGRSARRPRSRGPSSSPPPSASSAASCRARARPARLEEQAGGPRRTCSCRQWC